MSLYLTSVSGILTGISSDLEADGPDVWLILYTVVSEQRLLQLHWFIRFREWKSAKAFTGIYLKAISISDGAVVC